MDNRIWDLFVELRKELVEAQKIRAQVMGFKITFVAAAIGVLSRFSDDTELFAIPAFAAMCFDFIIYSYSFSIKRIGCYTHEQIEPSLKSNGQMPQNMTLWEEFLTDERTKQKLSLVGNLGFTLLTVIVAAVFLCNSDRAFTSLPLLVVLFAFFGMVVRIAWFVPKRLKKEPSEH